ncbi:MAG: hypothetical protein K2Y37_09755 [Pirellulales bacterium]|nr:hypothetical protein [Pirellulales bacterium]
MSSNVQGTLRARIDHRGLVRKPHRVDYPIMPADRNKTRRGCATCLAGAILLIVAVVALWWRLFPPPDRVRYPESGFKFPGATEITSIKGRYLQKRVFAVEDFELPRESWTALLGALGPSQRDYLPSKWQALGELEIQTVDGKTLQINLYDPGEGIGAFSAGPDWDSRRYYRGGDTRLVIEAITKAHARSIAQ